MRLLLALGHPHLLALGHQHLLIIVLLLLLLLLCTGIAGLSHGMITSSAFRTYHTPLNSQPDFINALGAARRFAETASKELGLEVRGGMPKGGACSFKLG
jgi:predicted carbohydrate-binding protein with CBM5 and CBM33 domain